MAITAKHLKLGLAGEEAAVNYLASLGWEICERNWRPPGAQHGLELDIVARHAGILVFVEVKTRAACALAEEEGIPTHAAFSPAKRRKLTRAAMLFLSERRLWALPCRFDLICVKLTPQGGSLLEHHDNVIQLGNIVDSSHSSWQPW
jgi:Predicted endonuclease distantly related to archaeal Holliday junction resolvase